jgi:hypothetical protein
MRSLHLMCFALVVGLLSGCEQAPSETDPNLTGQPIDMFPDDPGRTRLGSLRFTGGLVLEAADGRFGGLSAMELRTDGSKLLGITDQAHWMTFDLTYEDGMLAGVENLNMEPMQDGFAINLTGRDNIDSEGLMYLGGDEYAVSFERNHRMSRFDIGADWSKIGDAVEVMMPAPPGTDRLRNNGGIEALAGNFKVLYAGIEYPLIEGQPHTLWRFDLTETGSEARAISLALSAGFGLTGMTMDESGGLYLVERLYRRDIGNRIRIGYISGEALAETSPEPLTPTLLAEIEPGMTVDNIEAIALAEVDGTRRLFIASDDNFNTAQRTILLSFALEE